MEIINISDRDLLSVITDLISIFSSLGIVTTAFIIITKYNSFSKSSGNTNNHNELTQAEEGWTILNVPIYTRYKRMTGTITDIKKSIKNELKKEFRTSARTEA